MWPKYPFYFGSENTLLGSPTSWGLEVFENISDVAFVVLGLFLNHVSIRSDNDVVVLRMGVGDVAKYPLHLSLELCTGLISCEDKHIPLLSPLCDKKQVIGRF